MAGTDPVTLCAAGQARFYELAYAALGVTVRTGAGLWWAPVAGPSVFPVAGTLARDVAPAEVAARLPAGARVEVSDAWGRLDLTAWGLRPAPADPWMVRPAGPVDVADVPGLEVLRASTPDEVLATEGTVVRAAGGLPAGFRPGTIHPGEGTLTQPDLHLLLGLLHGEPVATAMAAVGPRCVFVSGVATLPAVRGRGVAAALTAAALSAAPDRPATLCTTAQGRSVYARLGFTEVGTPTTWTRPTPTPTPPPTPR